MSKENGPNDTDCESTFAEMYEEEIRRLRVPEPPAYGVGELRELNPILGKIFRYGAPPIPPDASVNDVDPEQRVRFSTKNRALETFRSFAKAIDAPSYCASDERGRHSKAGYLIDRVNKSPYLQKLQRRGEELMEGIEQTDPSADDVKCEPADDK